MSPETTERTGIIHRILTWLRAGYPQGIPPTDYVALYGLLHRKLTEQDVQLVAASLASEGLVEADEDAIREAIRASVHETPDENDVNRVRARLAAGGWPLANTRELR